MPDETTTRYERSDFNARIISYYAVGLVILCVSAAVFVWLLENKLDRFFGYRGEATWTDSPTLEPPAPRLQTDAPRDLGQMRAEEDAVLQNYGWVDRQNGVVRVPIDVAMRLVVVRGLPTRKNPPPAKPNPAP